MNCYLFSLMLAWSYNAFWLRVWTRQNVGAGLNFVHQALIGLLVCANCCDVMWCEGDLMFWNEDYKRTWTKNCPWIHGHFKMLHVLCLVLTWPIFWISQKKKKPLWFPVCALQLLQWKWGSRAWSMYKGRHLPCLFV